MTAEFRSSLICKAAVGRRKVRSVWTLGRRLLNGCRRPENMTVSCWKTTQTRVRTHIPTADIIRTNTRPPHKYNYAILTSFFFPSFFPSFVSLNVSLPPYGLRLGRVSAVRLALFLFFVFAYFIWGFYFLFWMFGLEQVHPDSVPHDRALQDGVLHVLPSLRHWNDLRRC